jgi:hypothetical protein
MQLGRVLAALVSSTVAVTLALPEAQTKAPIAVDDLMRLRSMVDVQMAPDGQRVVRIFNIPTPRPQLRWSPDGSMLSLIGIEDGRQEVIGIPLSGAAVVPAGIALSLRRQPDRVAQRDCEGDRR